MITFLDGKLVSALPTQATVDVNGVGYEVFIPLSSYDKLPAVGQPIRILTHLAVREDAHVLYGFMTAPERDLFSIARQQCERHWSKAGARGVERDERE
jgi:Holliday junction resolvasome, DNA-binding subunit